MKTGAAGGFVGWRRGAREVLLEESRAGTGSEGGTAGGNCWDTGRGKET